jgi:phosphatidylglycerophosphate synthase
MPATNRRPLTSRETGWARGTAAWLARRGVGPNAISFASIIAALITGMALVATRSWPGWSASALYLLAALAIQARLLCNLFDGMVAVEHGRRTPAGDVWNDLPDRIADPLILVAAGAAITVCPWGRDLGWLAALLAVLTAYLRLLGGACGLAQSFAGPMAKQQRMAVMTAACVLAAAVHHRGWDGWVLAGALTVVILGAAWTCVRRTRGIVAALAARAAA